MTTQTPTTPTTPPVERSNLDNKMRRLLRLPANGPKATPQEARKAFQTSILVATVRCLLLYIFLPFVLPIIGVASGVGPWLGLPISIAAVGAVTMSIRRFWRADHSKRWHYTILGTIVICFMAYLIVKDAIAIAT